MMQWGEYLCRGALQAPQTTTHQEEPIASSTAAFDKLSSKLEQVLKNLGLSNFSSSVAKQFLVVSCFMVCVSNVLTIIGEIK